MTTFWRFHPDHYLKHSPAAKGNRMASIKVDVVQNPCQEVCRQFHSKQLHCTENWENMLHLRSQVKHWKIWFGQENFCRGDWWEVLKKELWWRRDDENNENLEVSWSVTYWYLTWMEWCTYCLEDNEEMCRGKAMTCVWNCLGHFK